ncbi:hypothetical protein HDU83_009670 [Entophlyctis luteolus]|nr:hypothetical protein HDU83_009670 [Entophlyctis luteolus]
MSSAYGSLAPSSASAVPLPLPVNSVLKNGTRVSLVQVTPEMLSNGATLARLQALLNHEIECGNTYPQEFSLDEDSFKVGLIVYWLTNNSNLEAYFLSAAAFMLKTHDNHIVGSFYIKPNYPGRCSHICNGGFITASEWRGQGVGKIMGKAFIQLAPLLGYKASVFNLVFE